MSVVEQERHSFNVHFVREQVQNQLQPGQESMGDAPVLSHGSLLRNLGQKQTDAPENCRERETKC
jgi:hypothetical protein